MCFSSSKDPKTKQSIFLSSQVYAYTVYKAKEECERKFRPICCRYLQSLRFSHRVKLPDWLWNQQLHCSPPTLPMQALTDDPFYYFYDSTTDNKSLDLNIILDCPSPHLQAGAADASEPHVLRSGPARWCSASPTWCTEEWRSMETHHPAWRTPAPTSFWASACS